MKIARDATHLLTNMGKMMIEFSAMDWLTIQLMNLLKNANFICKNSNILCEYISIGVNNNDCISLPTFKPGEMYKCMEKNKLYTLDEAGL